MARSYHSTVLSGKLWQAVRQATNREGGGCLLPDDQFTKTGQPVAEFLQEKHPYMPVPPMDNLMCAVFEKYEELSELVSIDLPEDDVTWVTSRISGAAGALGAEAIELQNWLLRFGCASEELRVVVSSLYYWMAKSSPPWAAYRALMACCLVALDKRPGVRPVGISKTLRRALVKLVMRAPGYQAKTACGNLQLCAGLEAGIEGATHTVGQRRLERVRGRQRKEEEAEEAEEEDEVGGIAVGLTNLTMEMAGTEEEPADGLEAALGMEVK